MARKLPPVKTAALPQYQYSEEIRRRFRDAALEGWTSIPRSKWSEEEEKVVEDSEKAADAFDYFFQNKHALEQEFLDELSLQIGEDRAQYFVNVVSSDWYFNHN